MSKRKSKRRKPAKPPRVDRANLPPNLPERPERKINLATALTVLGLIVGMTGLVTLRPQLAVSPGEPIERSQPFTVPFKITNAGLLAIRNVHVIGYVHRLEIGGFSMEKSIMESAGWTADELGRGESKTIVFRLLKAPAPPKTADIAIVVDYQAYALPFMTPRNVFRFVGEYVDTWQWLPQPSAEIRKEIDEQIE